MYKCTEYTELISAYTDGELPEHDIRRLEAHLSECANCSSILEAYRRISHAINESCIPAPATLRTGVMERIASADPIRIDANMKKFKLMNIILTRYVPAAACLVFLLLTVPRLIGRGGPLNRLESASAPMSSSISGADSGAMTTSGGGAPAPGGGSADYDRASEDSMMIEESEMSVADSDLPVPAQEPSPNAAPEAAWNNESPAEAAGDTHARDDAVGASEPDSQAGGPFENDSNMEAGESGAASAQSLYAIIRITGTMPAILEEYETESTATSGEQLFEIPREVAKMMLDEMTERERASVDLIDENGSYALVYYTP